MTCTFAPIENARAKYQILLTAGTSELAAAMDYGDAAMKLKETAPPRKWQAFIKEHIGASKTVTNECIRLAKARSALQPYLDGTPSKSIRGALTFLRNQEKGDKPVDPKKPKKPDVVTAVVNATDDELRAALIARGIDKTIAALPVEVFQVLGQRHIRQLGKLSPAEIKRKALTASRQADGSYAIPINEAA